MFVDPLDVIRRIGQLPIGDPPAMHSHAAQLRADADHLMALASAANSRSSSLAYEGPAATRFRDGIEANHRLAVACHDQLYEAATALDRSAGEVASAQAAWHRSFARVEAELIAAARRAAKAV